MIFKTIVAKISYVTVINPLITIKGSKIYPEGIVEQGKVMEHR